MKMRRDPMKMKMRKRMLSMSLLAGALVLVGCDGDDDSPPTAGPFTACGGSVVGAWDVQQVHFDPAVWDLELEGCPGATGDISGLSGGGSVTFGADQRYSSSLLLSGNAVYLVPAACELPSGACKELAAGLMAARGVTAASCAATATSDCRCSTTMASEDTEIGTYRTEGNTLFSTPDGEGEESVQYCVSGTWLRVAEEVDDDPSRKAYTLLKRR